jgi:predicted permease
MILIKCFELNCYKIEKYARAFFACASLNNSTNMPLILMEPLCQFSGLLGSPEQCFEEAVVYIFLYGIVWQIMLYGIFWPYVAAGADNQTEDNKTFTTRIITALQKIFLNPPMIGLILGFVVALVQPLNDLFFAPSSSLAPLTSTISLFAQGAVPFSCFVLAGIFVEPVIEILSSSKAKLQQSISDVRSCRTAAIVTKNRIQTTTDRGSVSENRIDIELSNMNDEEGAIANHNIVEEEEEADSMLSKDDTTILDTTILGKKEEKSKFTIGMVLIRLVVVPLLSFAVVYFCDMLKLEWILPQDRLFRFLVLIQAGMPSAQTCAIMMKQLGLEEAAYALSGGYVAQYCLCTITMTLLILVAQVFVS